MVRILCEEESCHWYIMENPRRNRNVHDKNSQTTGIGSIPNPPNKLIILLLLLLLLLLLEVLVRFLRLLVGLLLIDVGEGKRETVRTA